MTLIYYQIAETLSPFLFEGRDCPWQPDERGCRRRLGLSHAWNTSLRPDWPSPWACDAALLSSWLEPQLGRSAGCKTATSQLLMEGLGARSRKKLQLGGLEIAWLILSWWGATIPSEDLNAFLACGRGRKKVLTSMKSSRWWLPYASNSQVILCYSQNTQEILKTWDSVLGLARPATAEFFLGNVMHASHWCFTFSRAPWSANSLTPLLSKVLMRASISEGSVSNFQSSAPFSTYIWDLTPAKPHQ